MDALLATQDDDVIWAWAAAKGHDLVQGPDAPVGVCVVVHGSCYYRGPYGQLESGPLPVIVLMSWSMALPQPGSALMSEDPVATEGRVNAQNLGPHLKQK